MIDMYCSPPLLIEIYDARGEFPLTNIIGV
jgi:hypothetical protein